MGFTVDTALRVTSGDIGQALRQLEARRIEAILARDMPLLWQLHAPDYQLITPSGVTFSRERYLGDIKSGNLRYLRWAAGKMDVRASAQMAILRYQASLELDRDNSNAKGTVRPFYAGTLISTSFETAFGKRFGRRLLPSSKQ